MDQQTQTVIVQAGFRRGAALLDYLARYAQRRENNVLYWDAYAFTIEERAEADGILVLNHPSHHATLSCDPSRLIAFMMEPGVRRLHRWMYDGLGRYAQVYSPVCSAQQVTASHGFMGWMLNDDWRQLREMAVPLKTKHISCISSTLSQLEGHRKRIRFVQALRTEKSAIDFFGRGIRFVHDKMEALRDYRYSIAIENASMPHYFTEKINDCFLAYTVPLYYGCTNIGKYFPEKSFIRIDIDRPKEMLRQWEALCSPDDWAARLDELHEARELVLNKYQPLAGAAAVLANVQGRQERQRIILTPPSPSLLERCGRAWKRINGKRSEQIHS